MIKEFKSGDYFLCHDKNDGYSLNCRIDRSYKGKDDDIGLPVLHLTDEEAEQCRKEGFEEVY